jgi:hypothetical protein
MGWGVARIGDRRNTYKILVRKSEKGEHIENASVDGNIMLKCVFKKWDWRMDLVDLDKDRDWLRVLVSAVMNLRVL